MNHIRNSIFFLCSVLFLVGCGPDLIRSESHFQSEQDFGIDEEAEIANTTEHLSLLQALVDYRKALVSKDFGALKQMISARYYENGGTTDTTQDDYDHRSLADVFELIAQHSNRIKMEITVKGVEQKGLRGHVDYEYRYAYEFEVGDKTTWDAGIELNRLEFVTEDGEWKIISGL